MMTLKELRGMVTVAEGKKTMGVRLLRESRIEIVVKEMISSDAEITVYKNGMVVYQVANRSTVFSLPASGSYTYDSVDTSSVLNSSFFENEVWYMRLIMEGEDRLASNTDKKEARYVIGSCDYFENEDCGTMMEDPNSDFVADILCREGVEEIMSLLPRQQQEAIYYYFVDGMSQAQIAKRMHVCQQTVGRLIKRGMSTLRDYFGQ